jgi:hypothetical protein
MLHGSFERTGSVALEVASKEASTQALEGKLTKAFCHTTMSTLTTLRLKIYKTVARQLHGQVPCWVCGVHVPEQEATLEHILPRSEGGSSHQDNLAISHGQCNHQRHAKAGTVVAKTL